MVKSLVDIDLECSGILLWEEVATVADRSDRQEIPGVNYASLFHLLLMRAGRLYSCRDGMLI